MARAGAESRRDVPHRGALGPLGQRKGIGSHRYGCGSKPMGSHFGVGAPLMLEPILAVGLGCSLGGMIWIWAPFFFTLRTCFLTLPFFFNPQTLLGNRRREPCFSNPEKSFLFNPSPCVFTLCLVCFTLHLAFFTCELACFTPQPCFSHPKPKTT